MTPAEISILADAVEAESALNGQVALAFGWEPTNTYQGVIWTRGYEWSECPPMTTSLDALAAECKRRGWDWFWNGRYRMALVWSSRPIPRKGESPDPAIALCAALLRALAAEKERTGD